MRGKPEISRQSMIGVSPIRLVAPPAAQCIADRREKFLRVERFLEQPMTWRVARCPVHQVGATGDQHDGQPGSCRLNGSCERKTVHDGHADVRDQAVDLSKTATFEQRRSGRKQAHVIVRRLQQKFN